MGLASAVITEPETDPRYASSWQEAGLRPDGSLDWPRVIAWASRTPIALVRKIWAEEQAKPASGK